MEKFNPTNSFWEKNKEFRYITPFMEYYINDKSTGKKETSKIMWAIQLCYDPKSEFYTMGPKDKHKMVAKNLFEGEDKFEDDTVKEIIQEYKNAKYSIVLMLMDRWKIRMEKRTTWIDGQDYSKDNAELLDKMGFSEPKMWNEYEQFKLSLEEEDSGTLRGDTEKSLNDKRKDF